MVRTWIQADDLNYPSCVPWLGKNAVTENGAGNLFKYFRSGGSNNSSGYVELATPNLFDAWARSPYGDYVKTFFNNSSDYEAFKPNAYINLRLDRNAIGLASWTTWTRPVNDPGGGIPNPPINEQFQDLQWVAKYDLQGNKKMNPAQVEGVDSIRVLPDYPIDQGISDSGRKIKGTLRIRKTTN
jgi:hypothetical protein